MADHRNFHHGSSVPISLEQESSDSVFSVRNLCFAYGTHQVINGLSVDIREGAITTLIGANGCGKSTLFHLMTKDLKPDSGVIAFNGTDISKVKRKDYAKQVAIVHQYNTAPLDLSVEKLVAYGRTPYQAIGRRCRPEEDEKKVQWALAITDTMKYKDQSVSRLSGGQKQRVWIALALAQDTKILFLDEPTTYLDVRYQLDLLRLVRKFNRDHGITVLMILHDINQSLYYSDEIIAMKDGRIAACGKPEKVITPKLVKEVYGVDLPIRKVDEKPFVIPV